MKFPLHQFLSVLLISGPVLLSAYERPVFPFAPAAGEDGSTAIPADAPSISGWATQVVSVTYGLEVSEEWRKPENALGPAGQAQSNLLVLGRGGEVVVEFASTIEDGDGSDFVVFENSFSDTFLELAFVEVSSDGVHFVRYPAYSLTPEAVPAFGEVSPAFITGFAGKYRYGFGTPFDLNVLEQAHAAASSGSGGFSESYANHLIENFPKLDLMAVRFVRLIDIPGDGTAFDSEGFPIYDPYPTVITAGFDLDAVGIINPGGPLTISFNEWSEAAEIPADWEGDHDRDKWTNSMEYLLGSDPASSSSKPQFKTEVRPESNEVIITFERNPFAEEAPIAEFSQDGGMTWERLEIQPVADLPIAGMVGEIPSWGIRAEFAGSQSLLFRLTALR